MNDQGTLQATGRFPGGRLAFPHRDLTGIGQLARHEILYLLAEAEQWVELNRQRSKHSDLLAGLTIINAFFENSTRTLLSFEIAGKRLGADVVNRAAGASSLKKGMRVIAQGKLKQRSYETREGEKRTAFELEVEEIGPALRYATAQVTRTTGKSGSDGWAQQGQQSQESEQRPAWANEQPAQAAPQQQAWPKPVEPAAGEGWASGEYDEEPPF
jgi:hypothetical protein